MSVLESLDVTLSVKPLGQASYLLHCCRPIARILKFFFWTNGFSSFCLGKNDWWHL